MQNDKMTDEEVIKAFIETYEQYNAKGDGRTFVYKEVLDLINRQKANLDDKEETIQFADKEIKRLNAEIEKLKEDKTELLDVELKEGHAVCFDFDGVIHKYSKGWQNGDIYDDFNSDMMSLLRILTLLKVPCFICSTRNPEQILKWWNEKGFTLPACLIDNDTKFWKDITKIGITNRKLPAQVYIDDRAYNYRGQSVKEFFMDFAKEARSDGEIC